MPPPEGLSDLLRELPAVRLAVLFGSAARGEQRRGSDLDLGLLLDPDGAEQRLEVADSLHRLPGPDLDIVFLDEAPPLLRFEIARDGALLVERRAHDWADFRARAMIDWWDWAPTARLIQDTAIRRLREKLGPGHGAS